MKDATMIKRKGPDKDKRWSYAPIQTLPHLSGNEFGFLCWLLFRTMLEGYKIHISTLVKELGMDKKTVIKLCKGFLQRGFLTQDEYGHYHFVYATCHQWINKIIETRTGGEIPPELVEKFPQAGGNIPPTGGESPPELVEKRDHTSSASIFTSISKVSLSSREPVEAQKNGVTAADRDKAYAAIESEKANLRRMALEHKWPDAYLNTQIQNITANLSKEVAV